MCTSTCPAVFHMNNEGTAEADEKDVEATFEIEAKEAMEGCPVSAIEELWKGDYKLYEPWKCLERINGNSRC